MDFRHFEASCGLRRGHPAPDPGGIPSGLVITDIIFYASMDRQDRLVCWSEPVAV